MNDLFGRAKMSKLRVLPLAAGLVLAGCATIPTGPSVMVLPGTGKDFEQFKVDDAVCRQWALQQTGTSPGKASTSGAASGAAIGTALGAASGAAIGAASGNAGTGAAVGSGIGLLGGSVMGATYAGDAAWMAQRRYDIAYMQCMYSKGNRIPVRAQFQEPATTARPQPPPPPIDIPPPPPGRPPPPPPGT
jgi:hypothetical protein